MGYSTGVEWADNLELEQSIEMQLRHNHYPPVPMEMVPIAIEAVELARQGIYDKLLRLPEGITHRDSGPVVSVANVIQGYHLEPWLDGYNDNVH